jgi:hypothetical protein
MSRQPNCRIFLGNLASEKTSKEELHRIFSKYGKIIEDIVIRKSFGFIQYDNPESARAAIEGENGRVIGGMKLDLNLADNRQPKGQRDSERNRNRNRDRNERESRRERSSGKRKERSISPISRDDYREIKKQGNKGYSSLPILCQIIHLGPGAKPYAQQIEQALLQIGTFGVELKLSEKRHVPDLAIDAQKNQMRYFITVGRQNENKKTFGLRIFRPNAEEVLNEISFEQGIDLIQREELFIRQQLLNLQTLLNPNYINLANLSLLSGVPTNIISNIVGTPNLSNVVGGGIFPFPSDLLVNNPSTTNSNFNLPNQYINPQGGPVSSPAFTVPSPTISNNIPTSTLTTPSLDMNTLSKLLMSTQQSSQPSSTSGNYTVPQVSSLTPTTTSSNTANNNVVLNSSNSDFLKSLMSKIQPQINPQIQPSQSMGISQRESDTINTNTTTTSTNRLQQLHQPYVPSMTGSMSTKVDSQEPNNIYNLLPSKDKQSLSSNYSHLTNTNTRLQY